MTSPRASIEISHSALLDRVGARIADKRVLALVKAFLIAGILTEDGAIRGSNTGTPQGGILSPCLATRPGLTRHRRAKGSKSERAENYGSA